MRSVVLFVLACALAGCTLLWWIGPHDEGLMLQAAARIADGQWPYRDFWWNYGPGQPLVLAGLVAVFGPSLLWWRILWVLLAGLVSVFAWRLVRPFCGVWVSLLVWVGVAAAMSWPATPGPNPFVLAFVGGALLVVRGPVRLAGARGTDPPPATSGPARGGHFAGGWAGSAGVAGGGPAPAPGEARFAGMLCGVAIFFRPELGCAGALVVALCGGGWRSLVWAAGVGAVLLAPFVVVAPGGFLGDVVGFLGVAGAQRTAFPLRWSGGLDPNKLLEFYFPLILLAGSALWLAVGLARRRLAALPLVAAGVLYLLGRPDEFHLVPLSVVLAVALGLLVARERGWVRAVLLAAVAVIAVHGLERRAGQLVHPPALAAVPSPVGDGVLTSTADAAALGALLPRLHALAPPGRPILVAPPRFSDVRAGDPLLYVLAQRPNPTRYDVLQPGVVTTARVQREMIADLERAPPAAVVRWLDPRGRPLGRSGGSHLLDRWLASRYGAPERFGDYVLLRRRQSR